MSHADPPIDVTRPEDDAGKGDQRLSPWDGNSTKSQEKTLSNILFLLRTGQMSGVPEPGATAKKFMMQAGTLAPFVSVERAPVCSLLL